MISMSLRELRDIEVDDVIKFGSDVASNDGVLLVNVDHLILPDEWMAPCVLTVDNLVIG